VAEERVQRRLAAILAADVVGYSRLMDADEAGTLARLKSVRSEVFDPEIARFGGRIFKNTGDGALAEFASSVDAVQCAVDIQRALAARNEEAPEDQRLVLRIGISQGDVIVEGDDLFGNGVNVAARMEGLAEPGGICISGNVREHIGTSLEVDLEDLGDQAVKNIDRPVRCYRVRLESGGATNETPSRPSDKPSIAVLPFDNMSGDPDQDQEYFSDGIAEDIISALSRIRFLVVVARNSSFSYKGQAPDIRRVSAELGARYVLEGSVRKAGNRVRISAQLIDGATGNHLWAERYDRQFDDIFDVQDDITATVVGALQPELSRAERERARTKRAQDLDAWDAYQRGMWHTYRRTRSDLASALDYFERSRTLDADFAPAYWGAAICLYYTGIWGWADNPDTIFDEALALARRGLELDPDDSMSHTAMGYVRHIRHEYGEAVSACQTAMDIDPNNYMAPRILAMALTGSGRASEAIPYFHQALRLSQRDPLASGTMGWLSAAYLLAGEPDRAEEWARRALRTRQAPQIWLITAALSIFGHRGLRDEAASTRAELLREQPDITCAYVRAHIPISDAAGLDLYIDGLRKAGLPE